LQFFSIDMARLVALSINGTKPFPTANGGTVMKISLKDDSAFQRWRRLVIAEDDSQLTEPCAALDRARIPHVVGLHYRYTTPTGKPRDAEPWIMVPFQDYGAACSLLFSLSNAQGYTVASDARVTVSQDQ
jgi:hypothetical protein